MTESLIRLRPVAQDDLAMFRRFLTEPGLIGLDWTGFKDAQQPARRFALDGYLGQDSVAAGFVSWTQRDTPMQRIQAGTHPENLAEQKSLVKAGFQLEGVVRACEFRDGRWRDGYLYSRLRDDPSP